MAQTTDQNKKKPTKTAKAINLKKANSQKKLAKTIAKPNSQKKYLGINKTNNQFHNHNNSVFAWARRRAGFGSKSLLSNNS